ncbi:MAG: hypothetical protein P9M06_04310 [Candidatus Saelkia tenebricola]|nr:hypothetical protein [Candidatus Saelkia tenebricola]
MKLNKYFLLLVMFFVIYSIVGSLIIKSDDHLSTTDAPNHAVFCLRDYQNTLEVFRDIDINFLKNIQRLKDIFTKGVIYWPKFVYLTSFPLMYFSESTVAALKITNVFYLFLLMVFSYLLTLKLGGKRNEGVWVASLMPLYPFISKSISSYGLDFPLTVSVVIFLYLLLKTEGFKNTFYSLLLGLILGISTLIKGQVLLFVSAPLLVYFINSVIREIKGRKDLISIFVIFANLVIFGIFSFQIGSLWWGGKLDEILLSFGEHVGSGIKHLESYPQEAYGSLSYYFFYFKYLFLKGLGPLLMIITGAFCLRYIFVFKDKGKRILLVWVLVPFFIFSVLLVVHQLRFIMPIVPAMGIMTVLGSRFRKNSLTFILRFIMLSLACFQLFLLFGGINKGRFRSLFSFDGDMILNKDNPNASIAEYFINELKNNFSEDIYKVVIIRFADIEDGPMGLQFWIENKGYQHGVRLITHDIFDQWNAAYQWLSEEGKYMILFIGNEEFNFDNKDLWDKNEILKIGKQWMPRFEAFKNCSQTKELLDSILPVVKSNSNYVSSFSCEDYYYCEIYEYSNVQQSY